MSTIGKLLKHERPEFTKGEQQWDYLYSEDAALAMCLLGEKGIDGKIYCIGGGTVRPLYEYIQMIRDNIDKDAELGLGDIEYGKDQVMYLCADITDLKQDVGFLPEYTFEEGIKKTIEWYKQNN